jgi:electron transfer flavoprotein beta subunit
MKIVVLVKHVPDTAGERRLTEAGTLDRAGADGRLCELDEYAIEQALRVADELPGTHVAYLTMGPADAAESLRKALAMGGDEAVHICDERLAGADYLTTSLILAKTVQALGFDIVLTGMASTDGAGGVLPAMLAQRLDAAQITCAAQLEVADGFIRGRRDDERGSMLLSARLPAVVSVTDRSGEPRYPTFKGVRAAKKKPLHTWTLDELGFDAAEPALSPATQVLAVTERPARQAGTVVVDEGGAAAQLAGFLATRQLI